MCMIRDTLMIDILKLYKIPLVQIKMDWLTMSFVAKEFSSVIELCNIFGLYFFMTFFL